MSIKAMLYAMKIKYCSWHVSH